VEAVCDWRCWGWEGRKEPLLWREETWWRSVLRMKFSWWIVALLLVAFVGGGNSGLADKAAGKELSDDHRTYESEYGEPYETEDKESIDWSTLLAQMTPS